MINKLRIKIFYETLRIECRITSNSEAFFLSIFELLLPRKNGLDDTAAEEANEVTALPPPPPLLSPKILLELDGREAAFVALLVLPNWENILEFEEAEDDKWSSSSSSKSIESLYFDRLALFTAALIGCEIGAPFILFRRNKKLHCQFQLEQNLLGSLKLKVS